MPWVCIVKPSNSPACLILDAKESLFHPSLPLWVDGALVKVSVLNLEAAIVQSVL